MPIVRDPKGTGTGTYEFETIASDLQGVWARENTREALWDAMKRKETYATTGSRLTYFKKSGRYVCRDGPEAGQLVTTGFDLLEAYRIYFNKERDDDPAVSGLALALDTKKAGAGGRSSAFIREIRFYR